MRKTKKRPKKTNREWWDEHREQFARTDQLLRERIEYHRRKSEDERAASERR